jgi:hypothetical protein
MKICLMNSWSPSDKSDQTLMMRLNVKNLSLNLALILLQKNYLKLSQKDQSLIGRKAFSRCLMMSLRGAKMKDRKLKKFKK